MGPIRLTGSPDASLQPRSCVCNLSAAYHFRRVDLHEVGPVWLFDFDGIDLEASIKGRPHLLRIEVGPPAQADQRDVALGLPVTEGPEAGAGGFAGEDDLNAVFCADELRVVWRCCHRRHDAAKSGYIDQECAKQPAGYSAPSFTKAKKPVWSAARTSLSSVLIALRPRFAALRFTLLQ